jgi:hypothetical protein
VPTAPQNSWKNSTVRNGGWRFYRERTDKNQPNADWVVEGIAATSLKLNFQLLFFLNFIFASL